jgi:hypothetical protein
MGVAFPEGAVQRIRPVVSDLCSAMKASFGWAKKRRHFLPHLFGERNFSWRWWFSPPPYAFTGERNKALNKQKQIQIGDHNEETKC